jgi:hypothetical protein
MSQKIKVKDLFNQSINQILKPTELLRIREVFFPNKCYRPDDSVASSQMIIPGIRAMSLFADDNTKINLNVTI